MPESEVQNAEDIQGFSTDFDYKPLEKGFVQKLEESLFSILSRRGGKKAAAPKKEVQRQPVVSRVLVPDREEDPLDYTSNPREQLSNPRDYANTTTNPGYEVSNGLLFRKKTIPERVIQSIRFPQIRIIDSLVRGAGLVLFAGGAYLLYANLPAHPNLVLGIIMVSVAGNIVLK